MTSAKLRLPSHPYKAAVGTPENDDDAFRFPVRRRLRPLNLTNPKRLAALLNGPIKPLLLFIAEGWKGRYAVL